MSDGIFMAASAGAAAFIFVIWCCLKIGADSDAR